MVPDTKKNVLLKYVGEMRKGNIPVLKVVYIVEINDVSS